MTRGRFIAFEAMDAAGKNTQSKLLAEKLGALLLSFPRYETEIGSLIAANLKGEWYAARPALGWAPDSAANAIVRQALFTLDRYDAGPAITSALLSGDVVADRYWVSGLIYGASDLVDAGMLERVHQCLPQPDVWVLLDVPVEESFRRRPERLDVYERDREKLEGVRARYRELFIQRSRYVHASRCRAGLSAEWRGKGIDYPCTCDVRKWVIVDGVGDVTEVHKRVMGAIA